MSVSIHEIDYLIKYPPPSLGGYCIHHMIPVLWHSERGKTIQTIKRSWVTSGDKEGESHSSGMRLAPVGGGHPACTVVTEMHEEGWEDSRLELGCWGFSKGMGFIFPVKQETQLATESEVKKGFRDWEKQRMSPGGQTSKEKRSW
mgnify:CR=1 FL=1